MPWKKGTKITKFNSQVRLRRQLKVLIRKTYLHWVSKEDLQNDIENIILDYWGSMGPDCMFGRLAAA